GGPGRPLEHQCRAILLAYVAEPRIRLVRGQEAFDGDEISTMQRVLRPALSREPRSRSGVEPPDDLCSVCSFCFDEELAMGTPPFKANNPAFDLDDVLEFLGEVRRGVMCERLHGPPECNHDRQSESHWVSPRVSYLSC